MMLLAASAGCRDRQGAAPEPAPKVGETEPTTEELRQSGAEERREFIATARERMDKLNGQIEGLRDRMGEMNGERRDELEQRIRELEQARDKLANDLERAGDTTESQWSAFKDQLRSGMDEAERGYNRVLEDMKTNE
jgi:uncharacterized coiled-coil DUF342 family protein